MTPVILLSDGYIANGSEPWKVPHVDELETFKTTYRTEVENFQPYMRDENLSRPWAVPGTAGLEHRIGGLEKAHITGNVSYDPDNHEYMVRLRAEKVKNVQNDIPPLEVVGDEDADLLVLGWGGTFGAITEAVNRSRSNGLKVAQAHLEYLNPMPKNTEEVLRKYKKVLVPELNLGQLTKIIRAEFLLDVVSFTKIKGLPFKSSEIENKISELLGGGNGRK
jgi:2-oxoglutarate ferredoxin oxidoreductase subunit alpha